MAKKRVGRHSEAFRKTAVERLNSCNNVVALSKELGVHRRLLYKWRDQLAPVDKGSESPAVTPEAKLRKEIERLKRSLADKTLETDFFKGALQRIEARRQNSGTAGETAFTTKSGS